MQSNRNMLFRPIFLITFLFAWTTLFAQASDTHNYKLSSELDPVTRIMLSNHGLEDPRFLDAWFHLVESLSKYSEVPLFIFHDLSFSLRSRIDGLPGEVSMVEFDSGSLLRYSWVRDWFPVSTKNELVSFSDRGEWLTDQFPTSKKKVLLNNTIYEEYAVVRNSNGGNLLVTPGGICLTVGAESHLSPLFYFNIFVQNLCRDIVLLPPLPFDSTKHVDVFVMPVAEKVVLLGKWKDRFNFDFSNIKESNFDRNLENDDSLKGSYSFSDINNILLNKFPDLNFTYTNKYDQQHGMVWSENTPMKLFSSHYSRTKQILEENGFTVIQFDQPTITVNVERVEQYHENDLVEIFFKNVIPSYVNSLIVNDKVFVPQFNDYATEVENKSALEAFKKYFNPIGVQGMDPFAEKGGSIHCLTAVER